MPADMMKSVENLAGVLIRPATASDAQIIGQFGTALMSMHYELDNRRFLQPSHRTPLMYAAYIEQQSQEQDSLVLVAESKGNVIGYVRIPMMPAIHSDAKPATHSEFIPATIPA